MKHPAPFSPEELKAFLKSRKILVTSDQAMLAKAVRKLAIDLGAKVEQAVACFSFDEAKTELQKNQYHILITDFSFQGGAGLELLSIHEAQFTNRLEIASLIMMGAVPSNSDRALIADSDADAVLITPVTIDNFKSAFHQAVSSKIKPSPFQSTLEKGKELLLQKDFDSAAKIFESSKTLDSKPVLSFYYLGQCHIQRLETNEALKCFYQGLELDPGNYRCLSAIYETHLKAGNHSAAYDSAAKLHERFPASTGRIVELVKLSVYLKKYTDIIDYSEIFKSLKNRDPGLNRVVVAGMLICAKYIRSQNKKPEALDVLLNAQKIALEKKILVLEVFRYFIDLGFRREAEQYFLMLDADIKQQPEAKLLYLELLVIEGDSAAIAKYAYDLLNDGLKDHRLYRLAIEHSRKMGRSEAAVQPILESARSDFPNDQFE